MPAARLLVLLALAIAGTWLWHSGQWRPLVAKIPALAGFAREPEAVANRQPAPGTTASPPLGVRTWTDAAGVVHFEQASSAPPDASVHTVGKGGTLADYERELEAKEGIGIEDIARARAARAATAAQQENLAQSPAPDNGDANSVATRQAYELMGRQQEALERIRAENNR